MERVEYTFHRRGATRGSASGRFWQWVVDTTITAPEGEFDHLPNAMYTARVIRAEENKPEPSGDDYEARVGQYHTGNGWYDVPGVDKALRKEDAIKALKDAE